MDIRDLQSRLKAAQLYDGGIDGSVGALTRAAIVALLLQQSVRKFDAWPIGRRIIAAQQLLCRIDGVEVGDIDGLMGTQTRHAFAIYDARKLTGGKPNAEVEAWRDDAAAPAAIPSRPLPPPINSSQVNAPANKPSWPKQSAMDAFFGPKGGGQVKMVLPYKMRIAWDLTQSTGEISVNGRCKESLERIFARTLDHYGLAEIQRLRLDLFGGCLNVRKMRGSATAWSIHSWGCAVDIDPEHNPLKAKRAQATLDNVEYDPFWRFVYDEGAIGLGRERDYDWMHFQFARL